MGIYHTFYCHQYDNHCTIKHKKMLLSQYIHLESVHRFFLTDTAQWSPRQLILIAILLLALRLEDQPTTTEMLNQKFGAPPPLAGCKVVRDKRRET